MGGNHILSTDIGSKSFTDWFIKYYCGSFFLSGINLSTFHPLKPVIYKTDNTPKILFHRSK